MPNRVIVLNDPVNFIDPLGLWTYASEYGTTGTGLSENVTFIESTVDSIHNEVAKRDAIVTYTTNGTHRANSLHYSGEAIDLRTRDLTNTQIKQILNRMKEQVGPDYDVLFEGDHFHIEYDPPASSPCP